MRRTGPAVIVGVVVTGAAIGWLLQVALTSGGSPSFVPTATLYAVLFVLAAAVLAFGWPVRRSVRDTQRRRPRVDPFYAMRVLVLAKASTLTGALLAGGAGALVAWAVSRLDLPLAPSFWPDVITAIGAIVLLAAGVIVEGWCRIPPQDGAELPVRGAAEQHR